MESDNGSLGFRVGLDNNQLATDAAKSKALLKGIGDNAVVQGNVVQRAFDNIYGMIAVGGVASIGLLGKTILDVTAKFEKFGIVLKNTLGDTKGAEALTMIANFAATTPFQLDEVTGAFIKMANQGFVPTREEMIKLGDLASSTGKSFDQLAEAVLDAQTGQFERLKEFGIKASANGDRVTFSFKEQKTTIENTNKAIQSYILGLGELKGVAGANEKISASLTGQLSNLGDKLDAMYNKIGSDNKGILYTAVGAASKLIENYETIGEVIKGLVAVYGAYKVATMVVAYQESARAVIIARNIAIETEYQALLTASNVRFMSGKALEIGALELRAAATNTVIAAEKRLAATTKASTLANPYVLAAVAVAALGYAIYKIITYENDLEKATKKAAAEISNEKDKAAQLYTELNNATEGTDEWKAAKQGILDQYGTYLTEQQKELSNQKLIAEAYEATSLGIERTIASKVRQESLDAVSKKYVDSINSGKKSLADEIRSSFDRETAADYNQKVGTKIDLIQYEIDPVKKEKYKAELDALIQEIRMKIYKNDKWSSTKDMSDVSYAYSSLMGDLRAAGSERDAINEAFQSQAKELEAKALKTDPILTTYKAQIEEIKKKKAIAEKELEALKSNDYAKLQAAKKTEIESLESKVPTTKGKVELDDLNAKIEKAKNELAIIQAKGSDPMKAIVAKQGEIDEYNKQLGIKEKAAKEEEKRTRTMIENSKEYLAIQQQIIDKVKELDAANASKNTTEGIRITKEISVLEKQLKTLADGGTAIKPISATIHTATDAKEQLKPMKQLTEEERKQLEIKGKKASADALALDGKKEESQINKEIASYYYAAADAADYLARSIGDGNKELSGMIYQLANIGGHLGKLAENGFKISKSEGIGMAIQGATQLIGMVINQAAENKRVMKEYYANIIAQQREYNLLLNDQIRLNSDIKSSVFLTNYEGRITGSVKALNDAQKGYNDAAKKFNESEAIVGKKNVVSGGNVLSGIGAGAALGAGIGSVVPVIGTVVGAVGGAIVGAFVGLFAKKKKDVVAPLLETYPALISANGEFNASLAKTLIANKQVTEETAATLQNLIDWKEKADEARKQMTQVISDLAGSLGDNLRNALVTAFEEGTNAAKVFGDEVSKVLENIVANMLFNKAFEGLFNKLEEDMNASYGIGPDGKPISGAMVDQSWTDDLTRFFKNAPEAMKIFNQGLADAKKAAGLEGLDIFSGTATRTGSSKGIAQASQDSVDELNGRFTAIQGHTFSMSQGVSILVGNSNLILKSVQGIEKNTDRLEAIETNIASVKQGIDTINLKGITLK